jgi:L-asparaginase II
VRLATIRSGEIESTHQVSVVVTDGNGRIVDSSGDPDIAFFYRSAIKPFQATISLEAGADLSPEQTAVACSSHGGLPAHQALVTSNLEAAGLTADALLCPEAWPRDAAAKELMLSIGRTAPTRLFNNCSGKHSAWLAACVAQGWPIETYLEPDHPLQQRVLETISDATGVAAEPIGVDGCGAPTPRGQLTGLARAFGRLSIEPRFERASTAMKRYPALVSSNNLNEGRFAAWWSGPVKGGAQGLIAAGRHGIGVAAKSHEGDVEIAIAAMVGVMRRNGLLPTAAINALEDVEHIPVLGGGRQVGTIEPLEDCDRQ